MMTTGTNEMNPFFKEFQAYYDRCKNDGLDNTEQLLALTSYIRGFHACAKSVNELQKDKKYRKGEAQLLTEEFLNKAYNIMDMIIDEVKAEIKADSLEA